MKFGFLSTIDNLLLPYLINIAIDRGVKNIFVILDSKLISEKDKKIWNKRTNGRFGIFEDYNVNLYKLNKIDIPFYFVNSHNSPDAIELYKSLNLDYLLNAGTPRKISSKVLNINNFPKGVINIHPGKLPQYRGCSCVEWAILNDDPIFNTIHFMDIDYDTGPIISSEEYLFKKNSNYFDIRNTVYLKGCELASTVLLDLQDKKISYKDALIQEEKNSKFWNPTPDLIELDCIQKANNQKYKYQIL